MTRAVALSLVVVTIAALSACPASRGGRLGPRLGRVVVNEGGGTGGSGETSGTTEAPPPALAIVREERSITVAVPTASGELTATLGALLVRPESGRGPTIVVVPGGGDISRNGTRPGDGVSMYSKPVDVNLAWAEAFAKRGAHVLIFDKRTCGPNDDAICKKNPQDDVDAQGPGALSRDVDAACALARAEPGYDGQLVLFAHGQATQVALSSSCARDATAVALLSPIPRAIDEVIVAGLKDRTVDAERAMRAEKDPAAKAALQEQVSQLKNLAGTREAEFASMKAGRFAPTARVNGATLAFWKGWIDLTAKTRELADAVPAAKIVVLGEKDRQYSEKDRELIRDLGTAVEVKGADHHLLTDGALAESTVDVVGAALDKVVTVPST